MTSWTRVRGAAHSWQASHPSAIATHRGATVHSLFSIPNRIPSCHSPFCQ